MLRLTACASADKAATNSRFAGAPGNRLVANCMERLVILGALGFLLCACAAPQGAMPENHDPYEPTNRAIFGFNLSVDRTFLRPTAERYQSYVPELVRDGIHNVLDNLNTPVIFANDVLQGEGTRAWTTARRAVVNSTLGVGGLVDVGSRIGLESHEEDFGQTLAVWGVDEGPYLVLPLLGPSNPRDAAGQAVDVALDPTTWVRMKQHVWWMAGRKYMAVLDARTRNLEAFDDIERDSLDFYATVRSVYRQHWASEIRNGMPVP
jgi:phospholipid-binding lipoprotein MlaA